MTNCGDHGRRRLSVGVRLNPDVPPRSSVDRELHRRPLSAGDHSKVDEPIADVKRPCVVTIDVWVA